MRILVLADIRFPLERANGVQTAETCHALARRGHDVTLVVRPDTAGTPRDPLVYYGLVPLPELHIHQVRVPRRVSLRRAVYVWHAVRMAASLAAHDRIFTRDLVVARLLLGSQGLVRAPVVYESHGFSPSVSAELPLLVSTATHPSPSKLARLTRREQYVWRHAAGYVTITEGLRREMEARFGRRQSVSVIPDGTHVAADAAVAEGFHRPPVVGYAGHLYPWKGVDVLLDALSRLDGLTGLVIGGLSNEPDLGRVKAMADRLAPGRVVFAGAVAPGDVAGRLKAADILVLPNPATRISSAYTSPLKLFEYMASGRPIVASDLPALREVLRHEQNALLVEPGNASALADAIRRLVTEPGLATSLAASALRDVRRYTWDARAERLDALLTSLPAGALATGGTE